jgi:hypothetical protein
MPLRKQGLNQSLNKKLDAALQLLDQGADPEGKGTLINNNGDVIVRTDGLTLNLSNLSGFGVYNESVNDTFQKNNIFLPEFRMYRFIGTEILNTQTSGGDLGMTFYSKGKDDWTDAQDEDYWYETDFKTPSDGDTTQILMATEVSDASVMEVFIDLWIVNPHTKYQTNVWGSAQWNEGGQTPTVHENFKGQFQWDNADGRISGIEVGWTNGSMDNGEFDLIGVV